MHGRAKWNGIYGSIDKFRKIIRYNLKFYNGELINSTVIEMIEMFNDDDDLLLNQAYDVLDICAQQPSNYTLQVCSH
jgi:hypothetical protein